MLTDKRQELEKLAQELLQKEILFQQDLERLIGKRPYEPKHAHEPLSENGNLKGEGELVDPNLHKKEPVLVNGNDDSKHKII